MAAMVFGSKEHTEALKKIQRNWPKRMLTCDGCNKQHRDIKSCGRDSNGDPDAPDLCFLCRKEGERGKVWSHKENRYIYDLCDYGYDYE